MRPLAIEARQDFCSDDGEDVLVFLVVLFPDIVEVHEASNQQFGSLVEMLLSHGNDFHLVGHRIFIVVIRHIDETYINFLILRVLQYLATSFDQ